MSPGDIREARQRLGLSQAQVAHQLQVPADTFAKWERGDLTVRHPELLRLALERLADIRAHDTRNGTREAL